MTTSTLTTTPTGDLIPYDLLSDFGAFLRLHVADVNTTRVYSQIVDRVRENPARYLDAMLAS